VKEQFKTGEGRKSLVKALAEVLAVTTPDRILISEHRKNRRLEGKSLAEIARAQKQTPEETALEMLCQPAATLAVFFSQSMDVVRQIMARDYILTGSDGWTTHKDRLKPHPRCYGTFPRKIRQFALDEKIIGLPFAIRSMTSLPAETFHLQGRGRIEEGCFADVAVIDMARFRDRADFADPHQYSDGVEFLLVNGVLAIERGRATGHSGGQGLRRN
jgi:N-acyl-D-aspartate/D-glutamate deacylase